jgi:hypothetical protein
MPPILDAILNHRPGAPSIGSTLLDLVVQVNESTDEAGGTVERAFAALDEGSVHGTESFRGCRLDG